MLTRSGHPGAASAMGRAGVWIMWLWMASVPVERRVAAELPGIPSQVVFA